MKLYSRYRTTSDNRWLRLLASPESSGNWLRGLATRLLGSSQLDPALPRLPDDQIQKGFVGSSGQRALREGFQFYRAVKWHCRELGRPISAETRILDFGCGWGR